MILKEYQSETLDAVSKFLQLLSEWREKASQAESIDADFAFDWAQRAWQRMGQLSPYNARRTGLGDPLPAFCLKIPTGGGKTLLAVRTIDLVNRIFLRKTRGLVLWVVPTTQIYSQTLAALKDLGHPYRQQLDLASGRNTLILEKSKVFTPQDLSSRLCVMLLMLPSANRETKETLRMFRDAGGYDAFFPPNEDLDANQTLLKETSNLDIFSEKGAYWGQQIKTSLGNVLRLVKPLIILDEGHKAYSQGARATLEGFNPCMIVELSATPPPEANVLVNLSGDQLLAEGMIKLDLHIRNRPNATWQETLLASIEHRRQLEERAEAYRAASGAYIRPICLIQVERTGKEQRGAGYIHAEDVREYLLQHPGILPEHVAVKTSQRDELKDIDEPGGLLSRNCPIRFIITKQALQEGWDCAFAYVLTLLTNPSSNTAMTQLVGRILRQPYAQKTGVEALDESYVFCYRPSGAVLLDEVRKGFKREGLKDLTGRITPETVDRPLEPPAKVYQRERMKDSLRDFVLPAFMMKDEDGWRTVRYETDILARLDWNSLDIGPIANLALGESEYREEVLSMGLDEQTMSVAQGGNGWGSDDLDMYFAAYHLRGLIPNPWHATRVIQESLRCLRERYSDEDITRNFLLVLETLRRHLEHQTEHLAQSVFYSLLESGDMRFLVVADDLGFNRLPKAVPYSEGVRRATREDGAQYQLSLFDPIPESELNGFENKVATYLDQQERLFFWFRNRSRSDYFVQGWKPGRIYADFIFALQGDEANSDDALHRVFVMETKGQHLSASRDTSYKRSVFDLCTRQATRKDWAEFVPAMKERVVRFEVVDEQEWTARLNEMLAS